VSLSGDAVRGQYVSECLALVAHGWNVDYSVGVSAWRLLVLLLERGTWSSGGIPVRARCWVLRERGFPQCRPRCRSAEVGCDGWLVVV